LLKLASHAVLSPILHGSPVGCAVLAASPTSDVKLKASLGVLMYTMCSIELCVYCNCLRAVTWQIIFVCCRTTAPLTTCLACCLCDALELQILCRPCNLLMCLREWHLNVGRISPGLATSHQMCEFRKLTCPHPLYLAWTDPMVHASMPCRCWCAASDWGDEYGPKDTDACCPSD
jgi:hypothetical protein